MNTTITLSKQTVIDERVSVDIHKFKSLDDGNCEVNSFTSYPDTGVILHDGVCAFTEDYTKLLIDDYKRAGYTQIQL